jgi:hypothetical protein
MASKTRTVCVLLLLVVSAVALAADNPQRNAGISMHFLPKRVADIGGQRWGLTVDYRPYLKQESAQPVLQSANEVIAFADKQEPSVRQNGVWIVTTNPDAYSEAEQKFLEDVKTECKRHKLPLFITRASELPNGWHRFDQ